MADKIIPNPAWFPTTLQERAAWMQNQNDKAQAEGLNYGLTQDNLDQIKEDNTFYQFLASSFVEIDTFSKAWTAVRNGVTTMPVGTAAFKAPDPLSLAIPTIPPTGMFQRIIEYRDVVIHSLNYTPEVGQNWGYESVVPQPIAPGTVVPTIAVDGAQSGSMFGVLVGNRGSSTQWQVQILRKGASAWENVDKFSGKTANVHITLTNPGVSEQIQGRIQLIKDNLPYDQLSLAATVTINP